ncbi:MAG: DUF3325 domain-containing protein [Porticoccaceae bacterium]
MTQIYIAVFSLAGFVCLMLAMPKHYSFVTQTTLDGRRKHVLRGAGWLALLLAVLIAIQYWAFDVGLVVWLGWLSVVGVALVFCLPYWPWQAKAKKRLSSRKAKAVVGWVEERNPTEGLPGQASHRWVSRCSTQPTGTLRMGSPLRRVVLALAVSLIPLAGFFWQLWHAPEKPLLRANAYHSHIGPWDYTLAEISTAAPEVEALQLGVKEFLIRFCDSCNAEIRIAYLKVREPRTLRSAGMSFSGNRERYVELAIPPKATLEDGLWLTVVSKQGEVFQQRLEIEQVSPAMAEFIRDQS